ncbi:carotenoid oxygenase [Lojkania enalia]|uniref:Carotenoid oxygenase n=1 Tax=Lojkania enalia TaxID=147567 RepID=A0A9P4KCT5_9PLEO|nr:carotenoid oxygenase [Didymosphaeria enalia]
MSRVGQKKKRSVAHPYLTGNFAPVALTHPPTPCTYSGTIPQELLGGEYVRNGGNPISNADLGRDAHWFDGDGMLAGVLFQRSHSDPNQAIPHFVNQYILTDICISSLENAALQTPILPSISTFVNPTSSLASILLRILRSLFLVLVSHLPGSQKTIKRISVANTNIMFHDGRALATCESGPPIRIQLPGLETVGWYDGQMAEGELFPKQYLDRKEVFGGSGLMSFMKEWTTGHPKVDPCTREMILFHCNFMPPYVQYSVIPSMRSPTSTSATSKLLNAPVPGCTGGKMMHDFGVSPTHTIIMDLPLSLSPLNLLKNKPIVSFEPDKPSRFGVFPRHNPSAVLWFETDGCCIFHTANSWDEYNYDGAVTAVNLLACRLTSASLVYSAGNLLAPSPQSLRQKPVERRGISFYASYEDDLSKDLERLSPQDVTPPPNLAAESPESSLPRTKGPQVEGEDEEQCRLYHYRFDLTCTEPTISHQYALSAIPFEFPSLNPAFEMSLARYLYGCSTSEESFSTALGKATKIDVLVKIDTRSLLAQAQKTPPRSVSGCLDNRSMWQILSKKDPQDPIRAFQMPPKWYAQEARFISRDNPVSEDDGFLLFYAFDESQLDEEKQCRDDAVSELWILDAKNMEDVVARVRLPQRVPYGLHGNWFSEDQIQGQRRVERVRALPVETKQTILTWLKSNLIGALR